MEIEVEEYVRTKRGLIMKLENNEEFYEDSVNVGIGIIPEVDGIWIDREHLQYIEKNDIKKHSKNIIDLIEEGDYVNGKLIHKVDIRENSAYIYYGNCKTFTDYQIKSIVTKEMFASAEYKVKE